MEVSGAQEHRGVVTARSLLCSLLSGGLSPRLRAGGRPGVTCQGLRVTGMWLECGARAPPSPGRGCQVWACPLLLSLFGAAGDKAET